MIECIIGKIVAVLGDLNLIRSYYIIQIYQWKETSLPNNERISGE